MLGKSGSCALRKLPESPDRCPPALAAEVSLLAAMLGAVEEAQDVLADRGVALDTTTVRLIAYR